MDKWLQYGKRIFRISAGFVLLLIGVIGGFVPVLQGWPFVLAGLALLAADFVWARRLKTRVDETAKSALRKLGKKTAPGNCPPKV